MPDTIINYIIHYGYPLIFCLVFLQELGVPFFPNEIVLLYIGFLCSKGIFSLFIVFLLVTSADIIGAYTLYLLFYYFGSFILKIRPATLKSLPKKINSIKEKIEQHDSGIIFKGRITPFIRGYISVLAGLLHISFNCYGRQVILSAILWTGGWVILGWITSPFWNQLLVLIKEPIKLQLLIAGLFFMFFTTKYCIKKIKTSKLKKI